MTIELAQDGELVRVRISLTETRTFMRTVMMPRDRLRVLEASLEDCPDAETRAEVGSAMFDFYAGHQTDELLEVADASVDEVEALEPANDGPGLFEEGGVL